MRRVTEQLRSEVQTSTHWRAQQSALERELSEERAVVQGMVSMVKEFVASLGTWLPSRDIHLGDTETLLQQDPDSVVERTRGMAQELNRANLERQRTAKTTGETWEQLHNSQSSLEAERV